MIAEYAAYYGGPPAGDLPWPLFLALVHRTGRFEARRLLTLFDSVRSAIGAALSGEGGIGETEAARERMVANAYPGKSAPSEFVPNVFAENDDA